MKEETDNTLGTARAALRTIVLTYAALILAALPNSAKALRLAQKLGAHVRRQKRVQARLLAHILREDLKVNTALQARVRRDLGGTLAMIKWERRRREAKVTAKFKAAQLNASKGMMGKGLNSNAPHSAESPSKTPTSPPRPAEVRKRWIPRTDRSGQYRLAVIVTGPRKYAKPRARAAAKRRVTRVRSWVFHPVQTTPSELRLCVYSGFYPPHACGPLSPGHAPPILRPPI